MPIKHILAILIVTLTATTFANSEKPEVKANQTEKTEIKSDLPQNTDAEDGLSTKSEVKGHLSAKISSLGKGLEYTKPVSETSAWRFGFNTLSADESIDESGVQYNADIGLSSASIIRDYNPSGSVFRVSAGLFYVDSEMSLTAQPGIGGYDIDGTTYTASEIGSFTGSLSVKGIAPYAGIGVSPSPLGDTGVALNFDLGVIYQGAPDTSLLVTCGSALGAGECATLNADIANENAQLKDAVKDFKWFPVISLGLSYKF